MYNVFNPEGAMMGVGTWNFLPRFKGKSGVVRQSTLTYGAELMPSIAVL